MTKDKSILLIMFYNTLIKIETIARNTFHNIDNE